MNPQLLVQSLKGSKGHVLIAFLFARAALDIHELKAWTGLKRETIYDACASLEAMGLLGTQTLAHGRTLWLPAGDMLPLMGEQFQMSGKRTSGIAELPTTTTESLFLSEINTVVVEGQMSGKRTSGTDVVYESYDASFEANLAACRQKGIGEPKATEISLMPHVCPALIRAHVDSLRKGERIGMAIVRITGNETPRAWIDQAATIERPEESGEWKINNPQDLGDYVSSIGCMWQEELPETFGPNHPLAGEHMKAPWCRQPVKEGSDRWCEAHYQTGVGTYGTGRVGSEE